LAGKILPEFKQKIQELVLVPGTGGCFELEVDGQLLYSKLKTGQFPDEDWVVNSLRKKL